ncbi:MAG: hypothetical protein ACRD0H_01405, partial [Actinomycetes bacterium]
SHLTRARRHLRRMGALVIPLGAALGWTLRSRPGSRVVPAALAAAVPVVVAMVALLPSSKPMDDQAGARPVAPVTALPAPIKVAPQPQQSVPAPVAPEASPLEVETDQAQPVAVTDPSGTSGAAESVDGTDRTGGADARPSPEGRSLPPEPCPLNLPLVGGLGCVLVDLSDGVAGGLLDTRTPLQPLRSDG